jgi:RNA polymerase sigma factor (TIGR02999 family)
MPRPSEVTLLLKRVNHGETGSEEELFELVYGELRRVASKLMQGERKAHTLQATALVHEVWIRLLAPDEDGEDSSLEWEGRRHFLCVAARAMRNLLVDHARAKATKKREAGGQRLAVDEMMAVYEDDGIDVLALGEALEKLAAMDPQLARLVELRFFGGLEHKQVAEVLDMSLRSAERGWFTARAFLRGALGDHLE